jgi:hypothetical protein
MRLITSSLAALVLCGSTLTAFAQTPPVVPPMPCEKPSDYVPVGGGTAEQMNRVKKRMETYKNCVNDYATSLNAKIQEMSAQAQAYQDAANKAVNDYNSYNKDMIARMNGQEGSPAGTSETGGAAPKGY